MTVKSTSRFLVRASLITLCLAMTSGSALSQDTESLITSLDVEIAALDDAIIAAKAEEAKYTGGVLAIISALNTQTLRLTQSVLEARKAAEEGDVPIEITVPGVLPDPDLAANILADIQTQQGLVDTAKDEASRAGGLMAAMALTRYETERLSLSQLRQAWYRAEYGIAFPMLNAPTVAPTRPSSEDPLPKGDGVITKEAPAWADSDHPNIDYTAPIFEQLASQGFEMVGWWAMQRSRAEIDDTPQIFAINVSDWGTGFSVTNPSLKVACIERDPRVIFDADTYLSTDYNSNTIPMTVRVGEADAYSERWSKLTNSQGAGLFGPPSVALMIDLLNNEKLFLRLEENNGNTHDLSIQLAGSQEVFEALADACQVSLLDLGPDDFRAIQTMLNAGGYDAGTPDGQWGPGSQAAMARYQVAEGLEETGAPNRETLEQMGVSLGSD